MPLFPRRSDEEGSIALALLVVVIMGGLLGALLTRTVAESRATTFDSEYSGAVHAAEVGLEDAVFRLNNSLIVGTSATDAGVVDRYGYSWSAQRQVDRSLTVRATGTGPNGVARTVSATIRDEPLFDLSLATHLGINFAGGNTADSYNSATQQRCTLTPRFDRCFGIIATNGNVDMGSASSTNNFADRVHIHDMANPLNNTNRCSPGGNIHCSAPYRRNFNDPLDIRGDVPLVQRMLSACNGTFTNWTSSVNAPASGNTSSVLRASQFHRVTIGVNGANREVLCADTLTFDRDTRLPADLTVANGYLIVVRNRMVVNGGVRVNCESCGNSFPTAPNMPRARLLQIFTLAQDTTAGGNVALAVQVRQQAKLGLALYAPDASCGNQQSNAQVEVYGSMVCAAVLNQGGWQFHYDEDLANGISTEQFVVARWSEE
jgi:Tfp pilus assembly protein PilX